MSCPSRVCSTNGGAGWPIFRWSAAAGRENTLAAAAIPKPKALRSTARRCRSGVRPDREIEPCLPRQSSTAIPSVSLRSNSRMLNFAADDVFDPPAFQSESVAQPGGGRPARKQLVALELAVHGQLHETERLQIFHHQC